MASVRDFKVAFTTWVARIDLSCDSIRPACSPGTSRIVTAGRFRAVAFAARAEGPFTFGGRALVDGLLCWRIGLKVGARKERNDSTVAEVHDVVEATAR